MTTLESLALETRDSVELLRGLGRKETDVVLAAAKHRRFYAKAVMTYQGEPADQLMLLWKGRARYFFETPNGKKLILMWITPGEILGGSALVSRPSTYILSTEAVRDSVALVWEGSTIQALARRFPRLFENAIFLAADYLSWYAAAHAALSSKTARERLAHVLVELAPSIGRKVAGGMELDVTNEELAYSANITAYTTSRMVSEWQRSGAIRKHRGKILLRRPERLFLRVV